MVQAGRGRGAGNEGPGEEKTGFHSRISGTPTGTPGQVSPRESDYGHLVQAAGV